MMLPAPYDRHCWPDASSRAGSQLSPTLRPSALSGSVSYTPFLGVTIRNFQSSVMTETQYPVRSIAAPSRGVAGGPARPPRCASIEIVAANMTAAIRRLLINSLTGLGSPRESIERPLQRHHQRPE